MNDAWRNDKKLPKELSSSTKSWECREHSEFCIEHLVLLWPRPWFATLDSDLCNFCCCIWWLLWIPSVTWAIKTIQVEGLFHFGQLRSNLSSRVPSLEFLSVKASPTSGQWDSRVRDLNSATHCQHLPASYLCRSPTLRVRSSDHEPLVLIQVLASELTVTWSTKTYKNSSYDLWKFVKKCEIWICGNTFTREHQVTQVGYSELEYEAWKCTCQRRAWRHADMPQIRVQWRHDNLYNLYNRHQPPILSLRAMESELALTTTAY